MKVFISQPMKDLSSEEIKSTRQSAIERVLEKYPDAEVIDSYFEDYKPDHDITSTSIICLAKAISEMAKADLVAFCSGWRDARGCRLEHEVATEYSMQCMYLD